MTRLKRIARIVVAVLNDQVQQSLSSRYSVPVNTIHEIIGLIERMAASTPQWQDLTVEWAVKNVALGSIRLPEDSKRVHTVFRYLGEIKADPSFRQIVKTVFPEKNPKNILDYTLQDLEQVFSEAEGLPAKELKEKENTFKSKLPEGSDLFYRSGGWSIVKVTSAQAACDLGRGTKWCTSNSNMAEKYLSDGPLYVLYKGNQKQGQLHISRSKSEIQFMNLQDRKMVPDDDLISVLNKSGLFAGAEKNPRMALSVAQATGRRFPAGEAEIATDGDLSYKYAMEVIKSRFPLGEPAMATKVSRTTVDYVVNFLKDRFFAAEPAIFKDYKLIYFYVRALKEVGKLESLLANIDRSMHPFIMGCVEGMNFYSLQELLPRREKVPFWKKLLRGKSK